MKGPIMNFTYFVTRTQRNSSLLAFFIGVALSGVVWAQTDTTYKVVDTGQMKCYNNSAEITTPSPGQSFYGQDANYTGNTPSYTDNGDGTVSDLVTGLMWQKSPDMDGNGVINYSDKMYFDRALAYADSFTLAGDRKSVV